MAGRGRTTAFSALRIAKGGNYRAICSGTSPKRGFTRHVGPSRRSAWAQRVPDLLLVGYRTWRTRLPTTGPEAGLGRFTSVSRPPSGAGAGCRSKTTLHDNYSRVDGRGRLRFNAYPLRCYEEPKPLQVDLWRAYKGGAAGIVRNEVGRAVRPTRRPQKRHWHCRPWRQKTGPVSAVARDCAAAGEAGQPDRWMVSMSLLVSLSRVVVVHRRLASSRITSMPTVGYSTTMW